MNAFYLQVFDAGLAPFFVIFIGLILIFGAPLILLYKFTNRHQKHEIRLNLSKPIKPANAKDQGFNETNQDIK